MDTDDSTEEAPGSASGRAPSEPLPDLATRIAQAKDAATRRRRELGLPDLPSDEVPRPSRKRRR